MRRHDQPGSILPDMRGDGDPAGQGLHLEDGGAVEDPRRRRLLWTRRAVDDRLQVGESGKRHAQLEEEAV